MAELKFRQAALKSITNPERLDRALTVTRPVGWMALVMLAVIAAVVVAWSILGQVSTYVTAQGIFLNRGGKIVDAVSSGTGTLVEIRAAVGDMVQEGQVLGEIINPDTEERHTSARVLAEERREALRLLRSSIEVEDALIEKNVEQQTRRLNRLIGNARELVDTARTRLEDHRRLFEQDIVSHITLDQSQSALNKAEQGLVAVQRQLDDLTTAEVQRRNRNIDRIFAAEEQLVSALRRERETAALLENQRAILAPVAGRLTEIKATIGTVLHPGQPLASIEIGQSHLEALLFLPPNEGKRVEAGMEVLVSPATMRHEEFGYIKGSVARVSEFPSSFDGMVAILQNDNLAHAASEEGPPYIGRVTLVADPSTASGFAWTSPKGADRELTSGTMLTAEVRIERQAPITLVVPLLKETFNL